MCPGRFSQLSLAIFNNINWCDSIILPMISTSCFKIKPIWRNSYFFYFTQTSLTPMRCLSKHLNSIQNANLGTKKSKRRPNRGTQARWCMAQAHRPASAWPAMCWPATHSSPHTQTRIGTCMACKDKRGPQAGSLTSLQQSRHGSHTVQGQFRYFLASSGASRIFEYGKHGSKDFRSSVPPWTIFLAYTKRADG